MAGPSRSACTSFVSALRCKTTARSANTSAVLDFRCTMINLNTPRSHTALYTKCRTVKRMSLSCTIDDITVHRVLVSDACSSRRIRNIMSSRLFPVVTDNACSKLFHLDLSVRCIQAVRILWVMSSISSIRSRRYFSDREMMLSVRCCMDFSSSNKSFSGLRVCSLAYAETVRRGSGRS